MNEVDKIFLKIFLIFFNFYWTIKHFNKNEIDIKNKMKIWFFFNKEKYRIYNKWISVGVSKRFAYNKARNNIPYFENDKDKVIWLRKQKLKRILKRR